MNQEIPHPCNRCENSRLQDIYLDGRWILWCTAGVSDHLADPDCPYFRDKFLWDEIPIPCNECQRFRLEEELEFTLVPVCSGNRPEYWGSDVCPYVKKAP